MLFLLFFVVPLIIMALICVPVYHDFFTTTLKGKPSFFPNTFAHNFLRLSALVIPIALIIFLICLIPLAL